MTGSINLSHMQFALFLCLGTVLIADAKGPAQLAAGGVYMVCSLAFVLLS